MRVIIDGQGRTPLTAQVFSEPGKALLAVGNSVNHEKKAAFSKVGAELLELPSEEGPMDLKRLLRTLGEWEITSVLVEGGGILLGSLFDHGLIDKVITFIAPSIIGGEEAKTAVAGEGVDKVMDAIKLDRVSVEQFGEDLMMSGYVSAIKRGD